MRGSYPRVQRSMPAHRTMTRPTDLPKAFLCDSSSQNACVEHYDSVDRHVHGSRHVERTGPVPRHREQESQQEYHYDPIQSIMVVRQRPYQSGNDDCPDGTQSRLPYPCIKETPKQDFLIKRPCNYNGKKKNRIEEAISILSTKNVVVN